MSAYASPPPACACAAPMVPSGTTIGVPKRSDSMHSRAMMSSGRQVDGYSRVGQQPPQVCPRVHADHTPERSSFPHSSTATFDDHEILLVEPRRKPGNRFGWGFDRWSGRAVSEYQDVTGEAESHVPLCAGQRIYGDVHAEHASGRAGRRARREGQRPKRTCRLRRRRERWRMPPRRRRPGTARVRPRPARPRSTLTPGSDGASSGPVRAPASQMSHSHRSRPHRTPRRPRSRLGPSAQRP